MPTPLLPLLLLGLPGVAQAYCQTQENDPRMVVVLTDADTGDTTSFECDGRTSDAGLPALMCRPLGAPDDAWVPIPEATTTTCDPDAAGAWCDGPFAFDLVVGTDGADVLAAEDRPTAFFARGGPDWVTGTRHGDWLDGGGGLDLLLGGDGDDRLCPGTCADTDPDCGEAMQVADGQGGDDLLVGGPDDDELRGGPGDDVIQGAGGDDLLIGGPGDDVLLGGAHDDRIFGGPGSDQVQGNVGSDSLFGGGGSLSAEPDGRDLLLAVDLEVDRVIDGGPGGADCRLDVDDPSAVGCTVTQPPTHGDAILFAARDAALVLIDPYTGMDQPGGGTVAFDGQPVAAIDGLAVDPADADGPTLWAVVSDDDGVQHLVTLAAPDWGAQPVGALPTLDGRVVDLAFDAKGDLYVLTDRTSIVRLDRGDAVTASVVELGSAWERGRIAGHMAWDDADGGFLFVTTLDPGAGLEDPTWYVDAVSPHSARPQFHFVATSDEADTLYTGEALTLHAWAQHTAGEFRTITGDGVMWLHRRKRFERKAATDDDGVPLTTEAVADPDALTIPHW